MPPRLLAGITLLFWGAMTGNTLLGLIASLLVEARSWIDLRWSFTKTTYVRAWHYTILCGALIAILAWVNGMATHNLQSLTVWAPLIFLPVELAMRYGKDTEIPLNTFSFFARKKLAHDTKLGRITEPRMINTGYPYIALVLLASAMSSRNELHHLIGLAIIVSIILVNSGKKSGFRPIAWTTGIILIMTAALTCQWGMGKLYQYYLGAGSGGDSTNRIAANESRTSIGKLGKLKLDPRIQWRMTIDHGEPPKLLRVATYNQYANAGWKYFFNPTDDTYQRDEQGYLGTTDIPNRDALIFKELESSPMPQLPLNPNLHIIGEVNTKALDTPIPIAPFMLAVGNIGSLGVETSIDCNSLGTVRLANPDYNIIRYSLWTENASTTETQPDTTDLTIPNQELAAILRVSQSLKLNTPGLSTAEKINRIDHFFRKKFTYTTHLTTPKLEKNQRQTAVGTFLETTQSGHCEYFAAATALLLREAGIPARYCVGFAVREYNESHQEWVMRGTHAHAWCRVWISDATHPSGGEWQDIDLTPPSWLAMESTGSASWQQSLADWWQRTREIFLLWRTSETNKTSVVKAVTIIIALVTLWIIWRLYKSHQPNHRQQRTHQTKNPQPISPLQKLEPKLQKILGARPIGMPLSRWTLQLADNHPDLSDLVRPLTELHNTARFSPTGISATQQQELENLCTTLRKQLKQL